MIGLSVALTAAVAAPNAGSSVVRRVHIVDIDFSPRILNAKRGDTVRWTFEDADTPHNVASRGTKRFRSSPTRQSGSYSYRFTRSGTYLYVCTIHFNMKGRVVVR